MLCLHPLPHKRAYGQSLQAQHQSLWGQQPEKRKTRLRFKKKHVDRSDGIFLKSSDGFGICIVIVFLTLILHRRKIE